MRDTRNALACAVRLCTCRPVPLSRSAMSDSAAPWTVARQALCPWNSPSKNTEVGKQQHPHEKKKDKADFCLPLLALLEMTGHRL